MCKVSFSQRLHAQITKGVEEYIRYMRRNHEILGDAFVAWFGVITRRVQEEPCNHKNSNRKGGMVWTRSRGCTRPRRWSKKMGDHTT